MATAEGKTPWLKWVWQVASCFVDEAPAWADQNQVSLFRFLTTGAPSTQSLNPLEDCCMLSSFNTHPKNTPRSLSWPQGGIFPFSLANKDLREEISVAGLSTSPGHSNAILVTQWLSSFRVRGRGSKHAGPDAGSLGCTW